MSRLVPITIACAEYDRTRAIKDGRVRVDGCEVTYLPLDPEELFFRAFRYHDFDIAELSFNSYLMTTSRNACPYVAIPAFVSRHFRHSAVYVRTDRNIREPADLRGKLVGCPNISKRRTFGCAAFSRRNTASTRPRSAGAPEDKRNPAGMSARP